MARGSMESATTSPVCWTTSDLEIFEGDRVNRYEIIDGELLDQSTRLEASSCLHQYWDKLWSDESGLGQPAVTPGIVFQNQIMSSLMSSGQVTNVWNGCLMKQDI